MGPIIPGKCAPTVQSCITDDLGYCCTKLFFELYPSTALVALRLGFTDRAIRKCKARAKAGSCQGGEGCLKGKLPNT